MSDFFKRLRAELNGSAQHRRDFLRIKEIVLKDAVALIRRNYLPKPPSESSDYDRGYGDAILDMTRLLDPEFPPPYIHIPTQAQSPKEEEESEE